MKIIYEDKPLGHGVPMVVEGGYKIKNINRISF